MYRSLYDAPEDKFLHDIILNACQFYGERTAIVDTSSGECLSYAEYGERVERVAEGLVAAGVAAGERIAIYLPNCWEFAVAYHAATLAGAVPSPLNPSYREREVRYQLANSGAAFLITDGTLIAGMDLGGLALRRVWTTRREADAAESFAKLLRPTSTVIPKSLNAPDAALAALPYSSGTTGLPKGVMLSHYNLVANVYQVLVSPHRPTLSKDDVVLCALPLYHIYGLNVVLNPILVAGGTLVLAPRFDTAKILETMVAERVTALPVVPPMLNAFCQAAEQGLFPPEHRVRWVKSGAAPLSPELARRFTGLTGIPIRQGYGMTEASPVTHMGFLEPEFYQPESIGMPLAATECIVLNERDSMVAQGEPGELVMRGPQIMMGYWDAPEATAAVLRDGWFWSGDMVRQDAAGFFYVLDRRKEMIKFKGFAMAPAEIEGVLLEHPAVRDCGVVGRPDAASGEAPCAFVVLREGYVESEKMRSELKAWVGEQLTHFKQPRDVEFVNAIPHTPSGKILRRELQKLVTAKAA